MPHVLMTADAVGGVWTFALELTRALAQGGVSSTLAVMGPEPSTDQIVDAGSVPELRIEHGAYRLEWMPDAHDDVARAGPWLLELERRFRPSTVHLNGYAHALLPFDAPVVVTAHSCVCSWNEAVGGTFEQSWLDHYRETVARGLAAADAVAAPSRAMLSALERHYGTFPRAHVVPNGRDARRFAASAKSPLIFSAGRLWDEAKNLAALVRVAPALSWPVVVAGEGRTRRGNVGNVEYLGRLSQSEVASWLARAAIVALPGRYEPFGLLALEAGLTGCALVLGDIPSQREIWGDAAMFVDPDSDDALARALRDLAADRDRLDEYGARARERALTYSPGSMAAGYQIVYGDAAAARAKTAASARRASGSRSVQCAS
jgi:glycosyltransferase involved in cell wall biosynthesis